MIGARGTTAEAGEIMQQRLTAFDVHESVIRIIHTDRVNVQSIIVVSYELMGL